jgi:hypothetical protein
MVAFIPAMGLNEGQTGYLSDYSASVSHHRTMDRVAGSHDRDDYQRNYLSTSRLGN